jgi:hypothetical protein
MAQRGLTLWEAVCSLAGKDGAELIPLEEAVSSAAAGPEIARTEIRQLLAQGLLQESKEPGFLMLTQAGRLSCSELHGTNTVVTAQRAGDQPQ